MKEGKKPIIALQGVCKTHDVFMYQMPDGAFFCPVCFGLDRERLLAVIEGEQAKERFCQRTVFGLRLLKMLDSFDKKKSNYSGADVRKEIRKLYNEVKENTKEVKDG